MHPTRALNEAEQTAPTAEPCLVRPSRQTPIEAAADRVLPGRLGWRRHSTQPPAKILMLTSCFLETLTVRPSPKHLNVSRGAQNQQGAARQSHERQLKQTSLHLERGIVRGRNNKKQQGCTHRSRRAPQGEMLWYTASIHRSPAGNRCRGVGLLAKPQNREQGLPQLQAHRSTLPPAIRARCLVYTAIA